MRQCLSKRDLDLLETIEQGVSRSLVEKVRGLSPEMFTPGVALQATLWWRTRRTEEAVCSIFENWQRNSPLLRRVCEGYVNGQVGHKDNDRTATNFGMFSIRSSEDFLSKEWGAFRARFTNSLFKNEFSGNFARAIAGAFQELAENVPEHAWGSMNASVQPALAVYQVYEDRFIICVGDEGVGSLASLRKNSKWGHLKDSLGSLTAIARDGASRRDMVGEGGGYSDLFEALMSYEGYLRLRSGDGLLQMEGNLSRFSGFGKSAGSLPGFQIVVECLKN